MFREFDPARIARRGRLDLLPDREDQLNSLVSEDQVERVVRRELACLHYLLDSKLEPVFLFLTFEGDEEPVFSVFLFELRLIAKGEGVFLPPHVASDAQ